MTVLGGVAAALLGLVLGAGYFGGLWWTVASLPRWRRPALALAVSFALRGGVVLAAFALLARAGLPPLAVALVGFLLARVLVTAVTAWLRPSGGRVGGAA